MKRFLLFMLFLVLSALLVACGNGDGGSASKDDGEDAEFPTRQVRYIVPYKTGGSSDITARIIEKIIRDNDLLAEPIVTTNIDGASTGDALVAVRDAKPDGHTLLHHDTSLIAHELTGVRDWGFRDFTPVAQLFELPGAIVTTPGKYKDAQEWIDDVKNNPGETTFAVSSIGGSTYLFGEQVLRDMDMAGKTNVVAYGSGSDLISSVLAGEDNAAAGPLVQHISAHLSGEQQILAIGTPERLASIPDVPTFAELGVDLSLPVTHRMGVWAPPETPDNVVKEIHDLFKEVIESDEFKEEAERLGFTPIFGDGEELFKTFEHDEEVLGKLVDELGIDLN